MRGVLDYAELVHRAVLLAERPEHAAELGQAYDAVFVDEYQDTDAAQVRLLRALAGGRPDAGRLRRPGPVDLRLPGAPTWAASSTSRTPSRTSTARLRPSRC
ncbi:hypothetical protein GCM10020000_27610 [Streptomyces olivoverticillatus]